MLAFLLLFLLSSGLVLSTDCPPECSCFNQDSILCSQRRSDTVPRVPAMTKHLYIFQNGINNLAQDDFRGLGELKMLDLSQNELTEVPDSVFGTLSGLENLDLSSNHITYISKDSFSGLIKLQRLYLHSNRIQSIHMEAFEGLEMLLELKLQGNQLTTLPFLHLPRLLLLDLSYNNIPALGPSDLQTPHLESLRVASLGLTSLDEELMASLQNLHELDISMNQLVEVPQALKQESLKGLIRLNLAANPLAELKVENFQRLSGIQDLDLSGLNIRGFPTGFLQSFPRLGHLTAAENPFNCMCPLAWFPAWLKDRNVNLGRPEETRCHFPLINSGKMLAELEHKDFGCPATTTPPSSPRYSTPVPDVATTTPETTHTNAIPPPPPPSDEPFSPKPDSHPSPPELPVSPSSSSGEYEKHICPTNICLNGGTCRFELSGQLDCLCPSGTSGLYCENMDEVSDVPEPDDTVVSPALPMEVDAISSRKVTATSILLDLHRFIETRPHIRGIRLTYRNLSGPDRRPIILSVPASYPKYTLRGLKPNCTYFICASPLGERVNSRANSSGETGSCMEARTAEVTVTSSAPRLETQTHLTYTLIPFLAALALVMAVAGVAATVICFRKRRKAKAGMELELGPTDPDPTELEGVKACPENGGNRTLAHKQPATDPGLTPQLHPSLQQNGLEYEVPLMQEHCPSNNNLTALKPSYF